MNTGRVIDEDGHEADGVLRPNGIVTFTIGRTTRHISLTDFDELGLIWKENPKSDAESMLTLRDPVDAPRYFRLTGEAL